MFRNRLDQFARFDADGSPGGNDGDSGNHDAEAAFQRRLDRNNNDGIGLARQLWREVYEYRQELKAARSEAATLQGKVPAEDALVLSGDDAKAWAGYKELGDPETVKQGLTQATELQGKLDALERDATLRRVAEAAGYKPSVLSQLDRMAKAAGKELTFELREQEVDGEKVQTPVIKEGETEKPLADYAASEWADFLPALAADATPQGGNAQPAGTRFPSQQPGATARKQETTKAVAESYVKNTYRRADNGSNRNDR